DGSPSTGSSRVNKACCNSQRFTKSRQAKLPIQHELTLALAGRVSRLPRRKKERRRRMMRGNEQERSLKEKRRCAMKMPPPAPSSEGAVIKYVCGIDIGSQCCVGCICRPDKSVVIKSITFANAREGWQIWEEKLKQLDAPAGEILIGMEATSRDAGKSLAGVGAARVR